MMKYLLDTNPCIVYLNGRSSILRERINAAGDTNLATCSIVLAELSYGAAKSDSPELTFQKQREFLSRFHSFSFDDIAARVYGPIRSALEKGGDVIGAHDLLIAAIAVANNLIVVSHNTREFARIPGLQVEDWEAENPAQLYPP
jgi:tRNA(fMet)-specific endonuclease VapC